MTTNGYVADIFKLAYFSVMKKSNYTFKNYYKNACHKFIVTYESVIEHKTLKCVTIFSNFGTHKCDTKYKGTTQKYYNNLHPMFQHNC